MELQQLQIFLTLAQHENMSVTAQLLSTTQPQVSKSLSSLEAELGVKLFDRKGRGIQLNEYGKIFVPYANDAISAIRNGRFTMKNVKNSILGTVTFGTFAFASILNPCVTAYAKENPLVNFRYINNETSNQVSSTNHLDILLCPSLQGHYIYENHFPCFHHLLKEEYYVLISPRLHSYPPEKKSCTLSEIQDFPFIIMGHGGIYQNNDYSILQRIGEITGTSPRIAYEVNEFAIKMLLVSQGSGIAYIPEVCLPMAKAIAPDIRLFTIEDFSTTRSVLIARKPRESMTSAANDFWDFALEYYHLPPDLEE